MVMCAIFGAADFNEFADLYDKCKDRGNFAFGGLFLSFDYDACIKESGTTTLNPNMAITNDSITMRPNDFYFFLGHTQAPTSSVRTFNEETSHPFICGPWVVAHNGVLTNDKELKKTVKNRNHYNDVDSSVIPALLNQGSDNNIEEVTNICAVLSQLEGTFGLWIYNKLSNNVYLARSGSTLHANFLTNSFSTMPINNYVPLEEGLLYLQTNEGLTSVGRFQNNSPFFVL
jgi:glucosamine 6-phosphate synthetase-like amidotransferase/phosphosugar isomerase protein